MAGFLTVKIGVTAHPLKLVDLPGWRSGRRAEKENEALSTGLDVLQAEVA